MSIDKTKLREFAEEIQELYEEESILPELANVNEYQEGEHDDLEYLQFGRRHGVPKSVFDTGVTHPSTQKFARTVAKGEKKYLLTDLANLAGDEDFGSHQIDGKIELKDLELAVQKTPGADRLFLPIADEYNHVLSKWVSDGTISMTDEGKVIVNNSELEFHQIPSSMGVPEVVVANSEKVSVVQKRFENAKPPKGIDFDKSLDSVNKDEKLMVYFGKSFEQAPIDSDFDMEIEILYRSVVSQPIVDPDGVFVLEPPEGIKLGNED